MQNSWMSKLAGLGVVVLGACAVVAGCSDDPPGVGTAPVATQQCGNSVASMNGQACISDGFACSVPIVCANATEQVANCYCQGGKFVCYGTEPAPPPGEARAPFEGEGEPACTELAEDPTPDCSTSVDALNGQSCEALRSSCRHPSEVCPGQTVGQFDTCDCKQVGGDRALTWVCSKNICGDGGLFVPDGGGSSSGGPTDGGRDGGDASL